VLFRVEWQAEIQQFAADHAEAVGINYFIQYQLHVQLSAASEYARSKNVGLKGDLPIGVNRQGYVFQSLSSR
jgi:4-alpha-glucanotransferase